MCFASRHCQELRYIHVRIINSVRTLLQELLRKEVVNLDDLHELLGKRPFESTELRNIDRFRGELQRAASALAPAGVWEWIASFRGPGLRLAGVSGADGDGDGDAEDGDKGSDDDDEGGSGGGGGMGGFWDGLGSGKRYPVAT